MSYEDIIKERKYKAYGYARVYYLCLVDNSGYQAKLLYNTLKAICRKFEARYLGVKSKGHGTKSWNKPHIHVLLLAKKPISLNELKKLIPKGFYCKLKRIRFISDLQATKKYIKEHIGKKKRGFLLNLEILALKILIKLLVILRMLRLLRIKLSLILTYQAHQRALLIKLREVRLVWML